MDIWQGKLYINGKWVSGEQDIDVINPATLASVGQTAIATEKQILQAVDAAEEALKKWRALTAHERGELLWKWHHLIASHKESLARTMTLEQGKPLQEARGEIEYANSFVSWYAEEGKRIYGETVPASSSNKRIITIKQPVGVVAAITPWNFPAAMITRKISPALAAGCTVVVKPSELTPMTAFYLVKLAEEAGFPPGVINVITGDAEQIGELWMADSRVRKISFTGSTAVGKKLMSQAALTVKSVSLELGGHAPFIITEHANLDLAAAHFVGAKYRNAGQTCVCPNRIYVHQSVKGSFIEKLKSAFSQLKVGNGLDEGVSIGALINEAAVTKVNRHIADALAKGAEVIRLPQDLPQEGYFVQPTILANVHDSMQCMQEETFGPLAPILSYNTFDEVVERANHTPYGLAAYIFSESLSESIKLAEALDYGIIGLNDGFPSVAQAPFGGMKESGLGREGGYWGIEAFLETKYISLQLN